MALRFRSGGQSFVQRRTSIGQLLQKMTPFVLDLADRDRDPGSQSPAPELTTVEYVPASSGLYVNTCQIRTDGRKRRSLRAKACELWMIAITARVTAQYRSGQQGFTPQRDQALWIEVFRMQRPETHKVPNA